MNQADMNRTIRFGLMADVQYADKDTAGTRHYRTSIERLAQCVEDFNNTELDFAIQLGDIIDGGPNAEKELDQVLSVYNKLTTAKYHVLGNHDFAQISRKTVLEKLQFDSGSYFFNYGPWRFIVLDTMDVSVIGGWPKDSENYRLGKEMLDHLKKTSAPNAVEWNGGISGGQLVWLDRTLSDADKNHQRAIIFAHNPVLPANDVHNAWNTDQIVAVLQSHDSPAAYINGHNHAGKYTEQNGIAYLTLKAMCDAPKQNAYATVELTTESINIIGRGKVISRTIPLKQKPLDQ